MTQGNQPDVAGQADAFLRANSKGWTTAQFKEYGARSIDRSQLVGYAYLLDTIVEGSQMLFQSQDQAVLVDQLPANTEIMLMGETEPGPVEGQAPVAPWYLEPGARWLIDPETLWSSTVPITILTGPAPMRPPCLVIVWLSLGGEDAGYALAEFRTESGQKLEGGP